MLGRRLVLGHRLVRAAHSTILLEKDCGTVVKASGCARVAGAVVKVHLLGKQHLGTPRSRALGKGRAREVRLAR